MIRITITVEAFEAIASTLPLGSVGHEKELDAKGERHVWLETIMVNRACRQLGGSSWLPPCSGFRNLCQRG